MPDDTRQYPPCPYCGHPMTGQDIGRLIGGIKSERKATAARLNAKLPRPGRKKLINTEKWKTEFMKGRDEKCSQ